MRNIDVENIKYCKVCKDELMNQVDSDIKHCVNCGETYTFAQKKSLELNNKFSKKSNLEQFMSEFDKYKPQIIKKWKNL